MSAVVCDLNTVDLCNISVCFSHQTQLLFGNKFLPIPALYHFKILSLFCQFRFLSTYKITGWICQIYQFLFYPPKYIVTSTNANYTILYWESLFSQLSTESH